MGRPKVWTEELEDRLRMLVESGANMQELIKAFPEVGGENAIRVKMAKMKLRLTGQDRVDEIVKRISQSDNLAHRILLIKDETIKQKKEKQPLPDDKTLVKWTEDILEFNAGVPFKHYARLPGTEQWSLRPIQLQDYQLDFIDMWQNNDLSVISSGRQIGKSLTIANYVIWKCVTQPNFFVLILAPTELLALELKSRIDTHIAYSPLLTSCVNQDISKKSELRFTNGSRVLALSAGSSITGFTEVDLVIIDEAGRPELNKSTVSDVRPMLSATGGKLALVGNPYYKHSPFYAACKDPLYKHKEIWTKENMYLPPNFLEVEKERCTPEEFSRSYCAVFVDVERAFIPSTYIDDARKKYDYSLTKEPGKRYAIGIDWGRLVNESVISVVSELDGFYKLEWMEGFTQKDLTLTAMKALNLDKHFDVHAIVTEYNGVGIPPSDDLAESIAGYKVNKFTMQKFSKWRLYEDLLKIFLDRRIEIPDSERELSQQLKLLETKATQSIDKKTNAPVYTISVPRGENDDKCDALSLGIHGLKKEEEGSDFFIPRAY